MLAEIPGQASPAGTNAHLLGKVLGLWSRLGACAALLSLQRCGLTVPVLSLIRAPESLEAQCQPVSIGIVFLAPW